MSDNSGNPSPNPNQPGQSGPPDLEYIYDVFEEFAPHKKGESTAKYGERKFKAYSYKAIAELIPKRPGESIEDYRNRVLGFIGNFYAAHPRRKGKPGGEGADKRETPTEYRERMRSLINPDPNSNPNPDPNSNPNPDPNPNPNPNPNSNPNPQPNPNTNPQGTNIEIGEVKIDGVKQEFALVEKEKVDKAKEALDNLRPKMAKLYAKNGRLAVGQKNREEFDKLAEQYAGLVDDYARIKAKHVFENGKSDIADLLAEKIAKKEKEIEEQLSKFYQDEDGNITKTQEEVDEEKTRLVDKATQELRDWLNAENANLKTRVNAKFIDVFDIQKYEMSKETNKAIDTGSLCRTFVSKVLNNKAFRGVLVGASIAGLAMTGAALVTGVAAGTLAFGGYTLGGVAKSALKGAAAATLMSRQDSRTSRVNNFVDRKKIEEAIKDIDFTDENADTRNAADWLLGEYKKASREDHGSNIKRTAAAAITGGIVSGLLSGVKFQKYETVSKKTSGVVDHEPVEYVPKYGIENVNVEKGKGFMSIWNQVKGNVDQSKWPQAFKITQEVAKEYGAVSDMEKGLISSDGSIGIFPGSPNTWGDQAKRVLEAVIARWGEAKLIETSKIGGDEIWGITYDLSEELVEDTFHNYLNRAASLVTSAAAGGIIGGSGKRKNTMPTGESLLPLSEEEAIERCSQILQDNLTNENPYYKVMADLGYFLEYPGFSKSTNREATEAALANLSEKQRDNLEQMYKKVLRSLNERYLRKSNMPDEIVNATMGFSL